MAAVSFGVLFTCGLIYQNPPEKNPEEEWEEEERAAKRAANGNKNEEDEEEEEEEEEEDDDDVYYHDSIWKNKPLLIFLLSTYLLNFGYYVPYVHLVSRII